MTERRRCRVFPGGCEQISLVIPAPMRLSVSISETRIDPGEYCGLRRPNEILLSRRIRSAVELKIKSIKT